VKGSEDLTASGRDCAGWFWILLFVFGVLGGGLSVWDIDERDV
jgi:hypothetical protein